MLKSPRTILFGALMFVLGSFFFSAHNAIGLAPCTPVPSIATAASTAYPTMTDDMGTPDNPVPLGTMASVKTTKDSDEYDYNVVITEAEFGPATVAKLKKAYNSDPPDGTTYLLFFVQGQYVSGPKGKPGQFQFGDFTSLAGGQLWTEFTIVEPPQPQLRFTGFIGAKFKGWVAVPVYTGDPNPIIAWGVNRVDGSGGVYFATH